MRRLSSAASARLGACAVLPVAIVVAACNHADAASSTTASMTLMPSGKRTAQPTVPHSGILPIKLSSMTGTEFSDWLKGKTGKPYPYKWSVDLPWQRRCRGEKGCATNKQYTEAIIAATEDAKDLDLDNLTGERVVARVSVTKKSLGRHRPEELRYGLSGGDFVYYLVVQPADNPGDIGRRIANWALVEVDDDGYHQTVERGVFSRCCDASNPDPKHCTKSPYSYASFEDCSMNHEIYIRAFAALQGSRSKADTARVIRQLKQSRTGLYDSPAWVTCSHGCCIAGT